MTMDVTQSTSITQVRRRPPLRRRRRRAEHAMVIPTPAQVGAILAAADPYQRPMWALGAFAGLRLGEASAVQASDVDFLRRTMRVQRQVQRGPGGLEVRPPKYGSERVVFLPDGLLELLARHLEEWGTGTGGWLVMAPHGRPRAAVHGERVVDLHPGARGRLRPHDALAAALLRLGADRRGVRRGHGPARARALLAVDHLEHVQPPVADCRGPHQSGRCCALRCRCCGWS